jgi:glycosyltransferase involved in cell wall biosynthesis
MPSPEELQSIATLEAMACGKPILAADGRALPELVEPGVNGYLFQPVQAKDAAHKMNRLIGEQENWAAMGQASFERSQKHSLQNTITYYEEQYRMATEKIRFEKRNIAIPNKVSEKSLQ